MNDLSDSIIVSTQNILESLLDYILYKITVKGQGRRNVHYGAKVRNWKISVKSEFLCRNGKWLLVSSHCPRCWWHLRDRDKLCTTKVGTCLLGPINLRSRTDLWGRFCSVLHDSMGWGAVKACPANSADILITTMKSWLEPSQKHGQLHFGMNVPMLTFEYFAWCSGIFFSI